MDDGVLSVFWLDWKTEGNWMLKWCGARRFKTVHLSSSSPCIRTFGTLTATGLWVREEESDTKLIWKDTHVERDSLGKLNSMKLQTS